MPFAWPLYGLLPIATWTGRLIILWLVVHVVGVILDDYLTRDDDR